MFDRNKTIYLVDTENVGSTWTSVLNQENGHLEIYLFITDNAKSLNYSTLSKVLEGKNRYSFELIHCQTGRNSLDFHLSSYLGYLIAKHKNAKFVILSADTGYDTLMSFWKEKGVNLSRLNTKQDDDLSKKRKSVQRVVKTVKEKLVHEKPAKAVKEKTIISKKDIVKDSSKEKRKETSRIELLHNILDKDDSTLAKISGILDKYSTGEKNRIYIELVSTFGKNQGLAYYNEIKKVLHSYYAIPGPQMPKENVNFEAQA